MANIVDDKFIPSSSASNNPDLQGKAKKSLLAILSNNDPEELGSGEISLNSMLQQYDVTDFSKKFDRQKEGKENYFEVGEKVGASFIVVDAYTKENTIDRERIGLLVQGFDTRVSDTFIIDISPEEYQFCQKHKGMQFEGIVEVTGSAEYVISNMFKYTAKVIKLEFNLPINPENIDNMNFGDKVIIEGEVVDFRVVEDWGFIASNQTKASEKTAIITIKTGDGKHICVQIDPNVKIEQSSELENIDGKVPEVSDIVRINTTVIKHDIKNPKFEVISGNIFVQNYFSDIDYKSQLAELIDDNINSEIFGAKPGKNNAGSETVLRKLQNAKEGLGIKILHAPWCRSVYLIEPNQTRKNEYDILRTDIEKFIEEVKNELLKGDFQKVREVIAKTMKFEVTIAERNELNSIAELIPENERPLMHWDRNEANTLNSLFDTDIDQMTLNEYYIFAQKCVKTPYSEDAKVKQGDHSYLFRIMKDIGVPIEQQEYLMALSANVRYKYFQGQALNGIKYDHDINWSDSYMLEQSLSYLGGINTPTAIEKLIDFAYKIIIDENLTNEVNSEFSYKPLASLSYCFGKFLDSPDLFNVFKNSEGRIREMEIKMKKLNKSFELRELERILNGISAYKTQISDQN